MIDTRQDQEAALLQWRDAFPVLKAKNYLVNHSLGAMPQRVVEALQDYAQVWSTEGIEAWETWFPMVTGVGDEVGALMNAPAGSVIMHQNVSTLQSILASCFDFSGRKNKVVYEAMNFTTVHYLWQAQARLGARIHLVDSPDGIHLPTECMLEAIDDDTLVVPISHVLFQSNYVQDAAAIMGREPAALQLRYLQTLTEIAAEKNSTIVFPMPVDLFSLFNKVMSQSAENSLSAPQPPRQPAAPDEPPFDALFPKD
jgi:kynureninase